MTLEHFRILEKLGAGGMGIVYRAHDERLDRDVALKVLPAEALADNASRSRLLREARLASGLNHPNICTIYAVAEAEGQAYIAMEYVEGQSLSQLIETGALTMDRCVRYSLQLADALAYAHEHGVMHRDLKSANVMVGPQGRIKVLDFGLAKKLERAGVGNVGSSQGSLTASGTIMGTPAYMAPEQLLGDPADARTDIWALGVVIYEMIAGALPFHGATGFELSMAILHDSPAPLPPRTPPGLHAVIERCLTKEPEKRYQRASEARDVLEVTDAEFDTSSSAAREERKLAAVLYSEVLRPTAGPPLDEVKAQALSKEHRRLVRPVLPKHGGREMRAEHDAFLVEFSSAVDATRCAIEIQTLMSTRNAGIPPTDRIEVRMGLHVGEVIHGDKDVKGDGVAIAAQLDSIAPPGGICISEDVARQIRGRIDVSVVRLGQKSMSSDHPAIEVYRVVLPSQRPNSLSTAALVAWMDWRGALSRRQWIVMGAGVLALGLVAAFNPGGIRQRVLGVGSPPIRSLVVLPLSNLSGDKTQDFMADGMTESLISELSKIGGLRVVSRTSAMHYKGSTKPLTEIVKELAVDGVVEGGVIKEGDDVRVNLQLIDAHTDKSLWGQSFDRGAGDILALHSEVVRAIANEVRIKLSPQEEQSLRAAARQVNPEAYEAYLKGRMHWYRQTPQDVDRALEYFQFAVKKDPTFPLSYLGMAYVWTYYASAGLMPPSESRQRLIVAQQQALKLDPALAEVHSAIADFKFYYDWDWAAAEKEYKKGIELKPNLVEMRLYYWEFLAAMKRPREAEDQIKRCLELDPLNSYVQMVYGMFLLSARRYNESIAQFNKILRSESDFGPARLGLWVAYHHMGRYGDAVATAKEFFTTWDDAEMANALAAGQAKGGYSGAMRLAGDKLAARSKDTFVLAIQVAQLYAFAGDKPQALQWLERAYEQRETGLVKLQIDPDWDSLRQEPRFKQLIAKMNFPTS